MALVMPLVEFPFSTYMAAFFFVRVPLNKCVLNGLLLPMPYCTVGRRNENFASKYQE